MKKNKILNMLITIVLLLSIATSVTAATIGVVNTDTVRVRKKATTDSGIVVLVSIGDKITIIGEEDGWYKVKVKDDNDKSVEGYIRKDLLDVEGEVQPEEPADEPVEEPTEEPADEPNNEPADQPSEGGENPSEQPGEDISAIKQDKTISTIKLSGTAHVGQNIQLTQATKIKILPSANSANIAELQANTSVTIVEVINSWCRVEAGENIGWVRIDQ